MTTKFHLVGYRFANFSQWINLYASDSVCKVSVRDTFLGLRIRKNTCEKFGLSVQRPLLLNTYYDFLTTFLYLNRGSCVAVYAGSETSRISSKIS